MKNAPLRCFASEFSGEKLFVGVYKVHRWLHFRHVFTTCEGVLCAESKLSKRKWISITRGIVCVGSKHPFIVLLISLDASRTKSKMRHSKEMIRNDLKAWLWAASSIVTCWHSLLFRFAMLRVVRNAWWRLVLQTVVSHSLWRLSQCQVHLSYLQWNVQASGVLFYWMKIRAHPSRRECICSTKAAMNNLAVDLSAHS